MKVKFVPQNVEFEIKPGESVMHLAEDNGIYVKSVCRGVPSCAECRVKIVEGETNVFAPVAAELGLIGSGWFIDRRRLSCQLQCIGDVTVDMTEQIAKQQGLIGGRKAKAAKAIGDRVEDEIVIRDTSASGNRRDRDEDDEEDQKPDSNPGADRPRGGDRGRRDQRPRGAQGANPNPVVIGGPKPTIGGAPKPPLEPSVAPVGPNASGGRIEPRPAGAPQAANEGQNPNEEPRPGGGAGRDGGSGRDGGGRSGRSRRGGRGRR